MLDVREALRCLRALRWIRRASRFVPAPRTFEAASFLRRNGADSMLIQRMLKEDLEEYIKQGGNY